MSSTESGPEGSPLYNWRSAYFTAKARVERLLASVEAPGVPDGTALASLEEAADDLATAARVLRHYLPERRDAQLEATRRTLKSGAYGNQPARYVVVWPDGEMRGTPYVQKPAAVKLWERATAHGAELRLWDERLGKFILGA